MSQTQGSEDQLRAAQAAVDQLLHDNSSAVRRIAVLESQLAMNGISSAPQPPGGGGKPGRGGGGGGGGGYGGRGGDVPYEEEDYDDDVGRDLARFDDGDVAGLPAIHMGGGDGGYDG